MTETQTAVETATPMHSIALVEDVSKGVLTVPGAMAIQTVDTIVPVRPKHVTDDRDIEIHAEAAAIVAAILENPSDIEITAKVYGLGAAAEASNTSNISLVDQKIGPVMKEIGADSMLGKTLTEIKANLDLVNPHVVGKTAVELSTPVTKSVFLGFGRRIVNEVVSRLPVGREEVMTLINERRDTIRGTIDGLKGHLWTERDRALQNAIQLAQVANKLADAQEELQEAAYQGQLVWAGLNVGRQRETDPVRVQALSYLANDLAIKVIDLQMVDQLNIQSRMGAETLINNCRGIQTLVGRVTNQLLPSVQTALAVKAAAHQQMQLAAAARGIGAAASKTIADTAEEVGQVSVSIAKMNADSLVNLDELERACQAYEKAEVELNTVVREAETNARGISNRLSVLNERARNAADPKTAARRAKEAAGV